MIFIDLLQSLSPYEKRKVKEALSSPFFNKNGKFLQIFLFLEQYKHDLNDSLTLKRDLHHHLFPKTDYDDLAIRHLLSKLLQTMEQILAVIEMQSDEKTETLFYLQWLTRHDLEKSFGQKTQKLEGAFTQSALVGIGNYRQHYDLLETQVHYANSHQIRYDNQQLQQLSDSFDRYLIANKLKIACTAYSLQTVYKTPFNIALVDEVVRYVESIDLANEPLIQLYYLGLQTLRHPESQAFFDQMKQQLTSGPLPVGKEALQDLFILAQNYCIRKVNAGQEGYFKELFELYQASLRLELVQHDPVQFPPAFKNMVSVALRLKAFTWLEEFIKTHTAYIQPTYREDYLNYNLARVHFEQQDYEAAQDHLNRLEYKDAFISLNARMLLAKTYYELGYDDLLYAHLDSFKQFLNRKDIMANRQNYLNNLKYIKRLLNLNIYDKSRKQLLRSQIENESALTEKKWLLEKMAEV